MEDKMVVVEDKTVVMDDRTVVFDRDDVTVSIDEENIKIDRTVSGTTLRNVHEEIKHFISGGSRNLSAAGEISPAASLLAFQKFVQSFNIGLKIHLVHLPAVYIDYTGVGAVLVFDGQHPLLGRIF